MASVNFLQATEKQPWEEAKELDALGLLMATGCDVPQDHQLALLYFKQAS